MLVIVFFRENKKLRSEIEHLHDDLTQKSKQTSAMLDGDLKTLQFDLTERSKVSTYSKIVRQHSFCDVTVAGAHRPSTQPRSRQEAVAGEDVGVGACAQPLRTVRG